MTAQDASFSMPDLHRLNGFTRSASTSHLSTVVDSNCGGLPIGNPWGTGKRKGRPAAKLGRPFWRSWGVNLGNLS